MPNVSRARSAGLAGVVIAALLAVLGPDPAAGAFSTRVMRDAGSRVLSAVGGDTKAPTKPGGLRVVASAATSITITWRKSNDNRKVVGYHLYRGDQRVGSTPGTRHTFASLSCGAGYRLGVEAYDEAGNRSARATIVAATTACVDVTPPTEPSGVARVGVTSDSVTLSWGASSDDFGVVEYEILRDGAVAGGTATTNYSVASLRCGTMYTLGVRARDAAGNRSTTANLLTTTSACPDTTAPTPPASLAVTSVEEAAVAVAWAPSSDDSGVQGYTVYRDGVSVGSSGSSSYVVSGLVCGSSYGIAVDAYDAAGNRSARTTITASTSPCPPPPGQTPTGDTSAPTVPANVTVTDVSATSISLAWSASSDNVGVAGYGLYRGASRVGTSSQTRGTFSGLACGRSYELGVDAYDAAGNRSAAAAVVASTAPCPDTTPPSTPTGLTQEAVTETTVALGWAGSSDDVGVAGYGVYLGGVRVGNVSAPGYTFSSLSCGTTYTVGVDAYDAAGSRSAQASIAVTTRSCPTDTQPPSVPQNQTVTDATQTSFKMSWSPSSDNVAVTGYAVYLDDTRIATTSATTYTYAGLACGRTYTVSLEAVDAAGNASPRSQASGPAATLGCASGDTTPPSAPAISVGTRTATSIAVSWTTATDDVGVAGYGYYRNGSLVGNGTGTSYTFGSLACGTSYTLAIDAFDAAGNRSVKATATASTSACETPPSGGGGATLYIAPNGSDSGLCSQATPCASFQRAYAVAAAGATVEVAGGTYSSQNLRAVSGKTGPNVVFRPVAGARVILGGLSFGGNDAAYGPDYITVRGMETTYKGTDPGARNQRGIHVGPGSTYITLEDMDAGSVSSWFADHLTVRGGDYGPCDAVAYDGVCSNNKQDVSTNVLIEGAYFHDLEYDASAPDAHWECMYLNGSRNVTIRGNRFQRCAIFDLFVTISGSDARQLGHENLTIENNWFAPATNGKGTPSRGWSSLSLAWCQNAPQPAYRNVVIRNNSFGPNAGIEKDLNADGAGCQWQNVSVTGNIGTFGGCQNGWSYGHNLWVGSSKCAAADANLASLPYLDPQGMDYHLSGATVAENFVPGALCPTTDRDGQARSAPCDAGSDER